MHILTLNKDTRSHEIILNKSFLEKFGPLSCINNLLDGKISSFKADRFLYLKRKKNQFAYGAIQIFLSTDALSQGNGKTVHNTQVLHTRPVRVQLV